MCKQNTVTPIQQILINSGLQVFFVLLAGSRLGSKWGSLSMIVYTLLCIVGLPVFAGGSSGIGVLLGPTGGYIFGFILAAYDRKTL